MGVGGVCFGFASWVQDLGFCVFGFRVWGFRVSGVGSLGFSRV